MCRLLVTGCGRKFVCCAVDTILTLLLPLTNYLDADGDLDAVVLKWAFLATGQPDKWAQGGAGAPPKARVYSADILFNDGDGRFSLTNPTASYIDEIAAVTTVGDFTGDSLPDILGVGSTDGQAVLPQVMLYPNIGGGRFGAPVALAGVSPAEKCSTDGPLMSACRYTCIAAADLDGDG